MTTASIMSVVDRIRDECPIFGGRVEYARALKNLTYTGVPECWVQQGDDISHGNQTMDTVSQVRRRRCIVVIAAPHPSGPNDDVLRDARDQIDAALVGWQINPSESAQPVQYLNGELAEAVDAGVAWRDQWEWAELVRGSQN